MRYPIPAVIHRQELVVVNSRFIATAGPATSVEQAHELLARVRAEFSAATHQVYAYRVGFGPSTIDSCSDDGEPPGTAGRPVLAVVQGSGLGDVAVVVTRYFGGTKLGTGGLVRAYGDAARAVMASLPRGERVETRTFELVVPYKFYDTLTRLVAAHGGRIDDAQFAAEVGLRLTFPADRLEAFSAALREASGGKLAVDHTCNAP
ncbi:MAG: YigZ family protein [Thermoflexales bacterium]|nr:YigZ family protein [Thermoflexales bacterium]